jgi:hypothetical protein
MVKKDGTGTRLLLFSHVAHSKKARSAAAAFWETTLRENSLHVDIVGVEFSTHRIILTQGILEIGEWCIMGDAAAEERTQFVAGIQRDINCLSDNDRSTRKRGLTKLSQRCVYAIV